MRRLKLRQQPKLIGVKKKLDRREAVRERKALSAAQLERSIERELIERLKSKAYGDAPLNVNETVWRAILDREKNGDKTDRDSVKGDLEMVDEETDEEEEMDDETGDAWGDREFVSDLSGDDEDDGLSDLEDFVDDGSGAEDDAQSNEDAADGENVQPKTSLAKRKAPSVPSKSTRMRHQKRAKKNPRVEVEYEQEMESVPLTRSALANW